MLLGLTTVTGLTGENAIKGYISMVLGLMLAMVGLRHHLGRRALRRSASTSCWTASISCRWPSGSSGWARCWRAPSRRGELADPQRALRPARRHADRRRTGRAAAGRSCAARCSASSSASCPGPAPPSPRSSPTRVEKKVSRHPEEFGHGAIEGVAGPESANNAASAGAMVPMLTLGIPGSATTAIMLGGLMMWGLRPGPLLFEKNPDFVWGLIASMYIGNVHAGHPEHRLHPPLRAGAAHAVQHPDAADHRVLHHRRLRAEQQGVGRRADAGVRGARLPDAQARLLAGRPHPGPGARPPRRARAPPVPDHLRRRRAIFFQRPISAVLTCAALAAVAVPVVGALRGRLGWSRS